MFSKQVFGGETRDVFTLGDALGALHHLPRCSEVQGYYLVLEGKGLARGLGETWEIWVVLLAPVSPAVWT